MQIAFIFKTLGIINQDTRVSCSNPIDDNSSRILVITWWFLGYKLLYELMNINSYEAFWYCAIMATVYLIWLLSEQRNS